MSAADAFTMSVRIPSDSPHDLRVRAGMALAEAAIDRVLAIQRHRFEDSLIEHDAPNADLADVLLWQTEQAREWRARAVEDVRVWLMGPCSEIRNVG